MNRSILASCSYDRRVCVWKEMQPQQWTQVNSVSFRLVFLLSGFVTKEPLWKAPPPPPLTMQPQWTKVKSLFFTVKSLSFFNKLV
jgi:hypothetical protein